MVLAGTGKEGKTKEVVKDREGKTVGRYVCMYVRMYVCSYMCVTKLRVKDAARERWCVCATVQTIFFASAAMSAALHAAVLRTWNRHGWGVPWSSVLHLVQRDVLRDNHACHAKRPWMSHCAAPATQNDGRCEFVPRLPRKMPRRHARPNQVQVRHPVPSVPHLPRKTTVDVSLCHACHAKRR